MNIYKKVPTFFYAVLLSLIINDDLYSNDIIDPPASGLRCEINELSKWWDEDTKNNIKQTIGLKEAKYVFLVPEKVRYKKNTSKTVAQSCYYKNKNLSVNIGEYRNGTGGILLFYHYPVYANEYRIYISGDTPLKPVFIVTSSSTHLAIYPTFYYQPGAIKSNKYYYFVVIQKSMDQHTVYAMKAMLK